MENKKQNKKVSGKEKKIKKKIKKAIKEIKKIKQAAKPEVKEEKAIKEIKEIKEKKKIVRKKEVPEFPEENLEVIVRKSPAAAHAPPPAPMPRVMPGFETTGKKYIEEKKWYTEFKPKYDTVKKEMREREYETPLMAGMTKEAETKRKYEPTLPVEREERRLPFEIPRKREEEKRYEVSPVRESLSFEKEEREKRRYHHIR